MYSYGIDIYMAELQVANGTEETSKNIIENSSLTSLLTYELSKVSSGNLTYKGIKKLSLPSRRVLKSEYITSKIDALVVCHFEKMEYIVFGSILIDPETNKYSTSLKLYSLEKNAIIHEMTLDKIVTNEIDYIKELSNNIDNDLQRLAAAEVITGAEVKTAAVIEESEETETTPPETDTTEETAEAESETVEDTTEETAEAVTETAAVVTPTGEEDKESIEEETKEAEDAEKSKPLNAVLTKFIKKKEEEKEAAVEEEIKTDSRAISVFTSLGYYIPFTGVWTAYLLPCISFEQGLKYNLYLANTENFDFLLRPAFWFNYTFAVNQPTNAPVHYHALKFKAGLDCCFEFANFFAFYAGGGAFYRFDIIDFQNAGGSFNTSLPHALGATVLLGAEFQLNKEKSFSLGLVNVLDMTLYSVMVIEYEILIQFSFKL